MQCFLLTYLHREDAPAKAGMHALGVFDHVPLLPIFLLRFFQVFLRLTNLRQHQSRLHTVRSRTRIFSVNTQWDPVYILWYYILLGRLAERLMERTPAIPWCVGGFAVVFEGWGITAGIISTQKLLQQRVLSFVAVGA